LKGEIEALATKIFFKTLPSPVLSHVEAYIALDVAHFLIKEVANLFFVISNPFTTLNHLHTWL
jgi:hypothetical protein